MNCTRLLQFFLIAVCTEALISAANSCADNGAAKPPGSSQQASPARPANITDPGIEFQLVPGGCFQMGDSDGDADEKPVHRVCLDSYFIGKFEVTQGQWLKVMGYNPSFFSSCGNDCPVENVNWYDAQRFINKLNLQNGTTYRLPTEAEWEYACRSGGKSERYCGSNTAVDSAWYDRNSNSKPHAAGQKLPNALGIHDMSGNVWEWVNDRFQREYYNDSPSHNPEGPAAGIKRGMRGGSWYNDSKNVRSAVRGSDEPENRSINLGFRLAFTKR